MKKLLFTSLLAVFINIAFAQAPFFTQTCYRGAFAPAPTPMWTDNWTSWDPQNNVYPAPTVTVSSNILSSTTWSVGQTILLTAPIYVKNNSVLTIQPGVVIRGQKNTLATLIITKGSQLVANGTPTAPIVFTSDQAVGLRGLGDWGGIILLGNAINNNSNGIGNIEGLPVSADTEYGGTNDNDNSGSMQFVRIEYCGIVYQPNQEINGLTLGAVGRATMLDNIQVSYCNDDAFEWFAGTVNAKHLVSYRNLDDDFDTDFGFSGSVQFCLAVRDPQIADNPAVSTSEFFESDNNPTGSAATPLTSGIFSNATCIGALRGAPTSSLIASGHRNRVRIRRNSALRIYNSIFTDQATRGLFIDGSASETNALNGSLKFKNNILAGYAQRATESGTFGIIVSNTFVTANANDTLLSSSGILTTAYNYTAPDYRPSAGSIALAGASFTDAILTSVTATNNPMPMLNVNSGTICVGQSFTINPTGINTFTIQGGNAIVSPSINATYTVVGTNTITGCSSNVTSSLVVNPNPTITVNSGVICAGQTFTINPNGANTYTIQGGNSVVSPSVNSSYSVTGTSTAGCISQVFAISNLTVNPNPIITVNNGAICSGQTFTINPNGANTYTIQGGNTVISPLSNSSYTVIGTNTVTGCRSQSFATSNLTVNPNPVITVNNGSICVGQSFTINPSGANTYTIQGGNAVVSPTTNSSYTVSGTSSLGCISQAFTTSSLTVNALPALTSTPSILLSACQGSTGAITGMVIPGVNTYTWTSGANILGNSINLNNQPAGSYLLIASNSNGCVNFFGPYSIFNPNAPSAPTASASANSLCVGQAISLFASSTASTTFNWTGPNFNSSTQNPIIPNSTTTMTGIYSVYATILGCSGPATNLTVTVNPNPVIQVNSGVICVGQTFTINPTGANTYTIQGGNNVVSPSTNSTYTIIGTSTAGCVSQAFATSNLTVNSNPTITVNSGIICAGQAFTINPNGANTYTIQGGNAVVNPSVNSSYTVSGTSTAGCLSQAFATTNLTVNPNPTITVNSGVICSGESFTINPTGANTYTIQGGNAVVSPTATTSYTISGTSSSGCKSQSFATSNLSVNICLGIEKNNENLLNILIYPNPTSDNTNLIIDTYNLESLNVNVYDVTGKLVMSPIQNQSLLIGENKFTINTKDLNNGMYFVILTTNKGNETVKLIINK